MELTKKERLAFIYQLKILENLYPDEAVDYANYRTALEGGYALHYDWMTEHLSDEMSVDECREVLDILDMYRVITDGIAKLDATDSLKKHRLSKFLGFDGNNEGQKRSYARYFIVDLDRYSELKDGEYPSLNSHTRMLETYQTMLARWKALPNKFEPSRSDIATILGTE